MSEPTIFVGLIVAGIVALGVVVIGVLALLKEKTK